MSLTGPDGTAIDVAAAVPADLGPGHVPALRDWLAAWDTDPAHRPAPPARTGADLVGVLHGVEEDGDFYDALVLDIGILFVRISTAAAMRGGMSDLPIRERLQKLLESSPGELLAREGSWMLETERILQATLWTKKDQWAVRLLVTWTDEQGATQEGHLRVA